MSIPVYDIGPGTPGYDNAVKYVVKVKNPNNGETDYYKLYSIHDHVRQYYKDVVIGKYNGDMGSFRKNETNIPDNVKTYFNMNMWGFRSDQSEYDLAPKTYQFIDDIMPDWNWGKPDSVIVTTVFPGSKITAI
jgi:hypothetical protein